MPAARGEVQRYDIAGHMAVVRSEQARHQRIVRHRLARALPWQIGGTGAGVGYTGWATSELISALSGPLAHLAVSGGAGLGTLAALAVLRYRRRDLLKGTDTAWYRRAGAGSAVWAAASAAVGPLWGLGAVALGGWVRWHAQSWLRPQPIGEAEQAPGTDPEQNPDTPHLADWMEPDQPSEGDRIRDTLRQTVLAGHELWEQTSLTRGWRWRVQLAEGVTYSAIRGCEEAIARPLHTAQSRILLEPVPDNVGQAILTVITVDLLAQGVPYNGPEYRDGRIPIGPTADGETHSELIVASRAGVHCGAFTGGQREGKSNAFTIGMLGMLASGVWITLLGDGDTGTGSNPILAAEADWPTGNPERVLLQLLALEAILEARQAVRGTLAEDPVSGLLVPRRPDQNPVAKILPSTQWPGYGWWLDEFHTFTKDETGFFAANGVNFPDRLETLIRVGAKYGIAVFVSTHSLLRADWGTTTLQAALTGVNQFAFRYGSGANGRGQSVTIDGESYALDELPHEGYFLAPGAGGRGAVMGRAYYPADRQGREFARPEMNEVDQLAAKPYWPSERRDALAAYNEDVERAEEWRTRAEAVARGEDPDAAETEPEDYSGYEANGGATVHQLHPAAPSPLAVASETGLHPVQAAVLTELRKAGRPLRNAELHKLVPDVSGPSMSKHLKALKDRGYVVDLGYSGGWAAAGQEKGTGS